MNTKKKVYLLVLQVFAGIGMSSVVFLVLSQQTLFPIKTVLAFMDMVTESHVINLTSISFFTLSFLFTVLIIILGTK
jgi:hypothetical protein